MPSPQTGSPRQLRQWVADRLRIEILEGRLPAGDWLRQEALAQQFGVSQTPVREALKQLAAEGLVEYSPYRGVRVISFSPEDVDDLYAARRAEEGRAARFAAERITAAEIGELRSLQRRMETCQTPQDLAIYRDLNRQFHILIIAASGRPFLCRSLTKLWEAFPTMLWGCIPGVAAVSAPGRDDPDAAEHEEILQALEAKDPARAEQAVQKHIDSAAVALVTAMRGRR